MGPVDRQLIPGPAAPPPRGEDDAQEEPVLRHAGAAGGAAFDAFARFDEESGTLGIELLGLSFDPGSRVGTDPDRERLAQGEVSCAQRDWRDRFVPALESISLVRSRLAVERAEHVDVRDRLDGIDLSNDTLTACRVDRFDVGSPSPIPPVMLQRTQCPAVRIISPGTTMLCPPFPGKRMVAAAT